jgi:hypothetical protein
VVRGQEEGAVHRRRDADREVKHLLVFVRADCLAVVQA